MLQQRVGGVAAGQRGLVGVGQVEVVDAAGQRLDGGVAGQRRREEPHQRRLAHALHAVEADEEGRLLGLLPPVGLQPRQEEGHAVRRRVVRDRPRLRGVCGRGGRAGHGWASHRRVHAGLYGAILYIYISYILYTCIYSESCVAN